MASALARVAVGHSLLFQDAVHAHQRTSARILREQQQQQQRAAAAQQVAASAPAAAGVARSVPSATSAPGSAAGSIGRVGSSGSIAGSGVLRRGQPGSAEPAAGPLQASPGVPGAPAGSAPGGSTAAAAAAAQLSGSLEGTPSPGSGVRLREDLSYEPMLHVGLDHGSLGGCWAAGRLGVLRVLGGEGGLRLAAHHGEDAGRLRSPDSLPAAIHSSNTLLTFPLCQPLTGGVYASADAARVGGGLYQAIVEALCTLATDPSPKVCCPPSSVHCIAELSAALTGALCYGLPDRSALLWASAALACRFKTLTPLCKPYAQQACGLALL